MKPDSILCPKCRRSMPAYWAPKLLLFLVSLSLLQDAHAQLPKPGTVVDSSITGFHYAADFSGTSIYTEHGPSDINGHSQPTAFSVTVSSQISFEQAKQQLLMLLRMSVQNGYKIGDLREKDTLVKGRPAYCISYTETLEKENYQNFVFNGVVSCDGALLVFTAGDLEKGKFIDLFRKTFYRLSF